MITTSDRRPLESGNEMVAISGRVINPTDQDQPVPPIRAELRDARPAGGLPLDYRTAGACLPPAAAPASTVPRSMFRRAGTSSPSRSVSLSD